MRRHLSSDRFLLIILYSVIAQLNCLNGEQVSPAGRILSKRQHDRDFAPRLTHQPHSVSVQPNAPHTSECPVESQPDSDVKWFKDNQLLVSEPMHLEQTGSELMFVQINDNDTGDYHCEATNYLGKVTSEPFRLTVQTSQLDEDMQLEPSTYVAVELREQSVEFKCTLPAGVAMGRRSRGGGPEVVSWRKNGRRLQQVVWLSESASSTMTLEASVASVVADQNGRYFARQGERPNEFILTIVRVTRARDDNSTFTCLYRPSSDQLGYSSSDSIELAHESRPSLLRVEAQQQQQQQPVKLNIPMGVPMVELNGTSQSQQDNNHTTQLTSELLELQNQTTTTQNSSRQRIRTTLSETLADLYEIAKPTLMIFGVMSLVLLIVLLQFLLHKRRTQLSSTHRYTKHNGSHHHLNHKHHHHHNNHHHHQLQYSSASSSSANSGANLDGSATLSYSNVVAAAAAGDPVLSSLLSRTLSATSGQPTLASSLSCVSGGGGGANAGKKFKSYRDHMRKVGATVGSNIVTSDDFIDASAYFGQQQQQQQLIAQSSGGGLTAVPNLYDQSLAAREQARSLLMYGQGVLPKRTHHHHHQDGQHHLELPLSFSSATTSGPLESGAASLLQQALQAQGNAWAAQAQQQLNDHQHYQLMSCSSVSPSSSSSIVAASTQGSSNSSSSTGKQQQQQQNCDTGSGRRVESVDTSNHYSTIETADEARKLDQEDDQYEQVDEGERPGVDAFVRSNQKRHTHQKHQTSARSSLISSRSNNSSSCESSDLTATAFTGRTRRKQTNNNTGQLSPYAVSSICNFNLPSLAAGRQQHNSSTSGSGVPTGEEAMRALNEQFDINQLVMVDKEEEAGAEVQIAPPQLPFSLPPPPPPPRNH